MRLLPVGPPQGYAWDGSVPGAPGKSEDSSEGRGPVGWGWVPGSVTWQSVGPDHKGPALGCQPLPSLPKLYPRLALPLVPGPWSSSKGPSWLPGPPPGQGWTFWGHSEIPQASLLGLSAGRRENQRQWADKGCIVAHGWGSLDLCPWEAEGSLGGRLGGWA